MRTENGQCGGVIRIQPRTETAYEGNGSGVERLGTNWHHLMDRPPRRNIQGLDGLPDGLQEVVLSGIKDGYGNPEPEMAFDPVDLEVVGTSESTCAVQ